MSNYKEMYLKLFRAAEKAADLLIAAQRECEEMYINVPEPRVIAEAEKAVTPVREE